jgi:hypothetical protein
MRPCSFRLGGLLLALFALSCSGEGLRERLKQAAEGSADETEAPATEAPATEVPATEPPATTDAPARLRAGKFLDLGNADLVGAADLDGDGFDELVLFEGQLAVLGSQQWELSGHPQRIARGDVDSDGDEELLVATGVGRNIPEASIRLWAIHADRIELLYETNTERNQVTDLQVVDDQPFISLFTGAKEVESRLLTAEGAVARHQGPMAMQQRLIGNDLVVGSLYGEAPRSHGGLSIHRPGQEPAPLPSLRGIRAISSADLDRDGHTDLLVSDGWHFAYGEHGDARLVLFRGPEWTESRPLAWSTEDYSFRGIEATVIEGRTAILLTGSHGIYLVQQDILSWFSERLGNGSETGNAVLRKTSEGFAVAISGQPARQIQLELQ